MKICRLSAGMLLVVSLMLSSCHRDGAGGSVLPRAALRYPTFQYVKEKEGGCADLFFHKGTADGREVLWISAPKGKVTLTVQGPPGPEGQGPRGYKASARLEEVVFEDEAGHQATLPRETISDVWVGW